MKVLIKITTDDSEFSKVFNMGSPLNEVNLMTEIQKAIEKNKITTNK